VQASVDRRKSAKAEVKVDRRTKIVWASFAGAMTVALGVLAMGDRQTQQGFLATNVALMTASAPAGDPVFNTATALNRERWAAIVIHDLGQPSGDADSIHRLHLSHGYQGLGYHFVIGNGNGLGDGVIHAGYRWNEQLPGVHTAGADAAYFNKHAIGICLVGNGERRPFTDRQMASLINLIQRLQRELDIPASEVHLHRDVARGVEPAVTSPGRYFARSQLLDQLR
jgi:hypothetical protein